MQTLYCIQTKLVTHIPYIGIVWCLENEDEVEDVPETTDGSRRDVEQTMETEAVKFEGWTRNEQSIASVTEAILESLPAARGYAFSLESTLLHMIRCLPYI
jgi:hypothetical protein